MHLSRLLSAGVLAAGLLTVAADAGAAVPLLESYDNSAPYGLPLDIYRDFAVPGHPSAERLEEAFRTAVSGAGWRIVAAAPRVLSIEYPEDGHRRYRLTLNLYWSADKWRLAYVGSVNLRAKTHGCRILQGWRDVGAYPLCLHPNASKWVDGLKDRISVHLARTFNAPAAPDRMRMY